MIHTHSLDHILLDQPSSVTIGVYDGIHLGHQSLIRQFVADAHAHGRLAVVLTFFPHPDATLHGLTGRYYLTSPEYRVELLSDLGVDVVVTHPFDDSVRQIRADAFLDKLLQKLRMQSLWVGADFALGYQREGTIDWLQAQVVTHGYEVHVVDLLTFAHDGEVVSSTRIRQLLQEGDIAQVNTWLGRAFMVEGVVVHGDARGRTIGFPTANLTLWEQQLLPANGVYAGWATVHGGRYAAVTNIGTRPTFDGLAIRVESYLLDFDADIYGATLRLEFTARLRDEQKFAGIDALKAQLHADVVNARGLLGV